MKVFFGIATIAALLTPVHGVSLQCAAKNSALAYESSGTLTADFTQKACKEASGSIDPNRKGNMKCCHLPDDRMSFFTSPCALQRGTGNFNGYQGFSQNC
eukprot:jgi/Phyca11/108546/e_gw1.15.608.1